MKRSAQRILTTHVGSLMRPPSIIEYSQALREGKEVDERKFAALLRTEVATVVREQSDHGVDVVSDGEFGKFMWTGYSFDRMSGFVSRDVPPGPRRISVLGNEYQHFHEYYDESLRAMGAPANLILKQWVCVEPIKYTDAGRALMRRDVENFKAALQNVRVEEAFLPVVAPCSISTDYANEYYKSEEEFMFAIADAQHEEYKIITDAGLLLQVDDAILANLHDNVVDSGRDYRRWVQMNVEALNHALRGIPEDRVRYHLCWGSWTGPHTNDVPLSEIVDLLLKVNAQGYSIEAANPRHEHEWTVWQNTRLPEGKILLPGVISHAIAHVEHPELVAQRIVRYANMLGRENVIASTDCGFAQLSSMSRQHRKIVWAKLDALAAGAALASKRLWQAAA